MPESFTKPLRQWHGKLTTILRQSLEVVGFNLFSAKHRAQTGKSLIARPMLHQNYPKSDRQNSARPASDQNTCGADFSIYPRKSAPQVEIVARLLATGFSSIQIYSQRA
jgi:hypothetical protein